MEESFQYLLQGSACEYCAALLRKCCTTCKVEPKMQQRNVKRASKHRFSPQVSDKDIAKLKRRAEWLTTNLFARTIAYVDATCNHGRHLDIRYISMTIPPGIVDCCKTCILARIFTFATLCLFDGFALSFGILVILLAKRHFQ